jgi:hypothetical protein
MKVRGRLRAVWLPLWLAGAAGCVLVGVYEDTPEPGSHVWWLPLFLFLAAVVELDESRLDFDFVTPDESSWNDVIPVLRWPMIGRATLICFVWDPDHDQITRALRDAHE